MANLNPKDNTYSLKDFIYRDVQRDWPGYSEDEKTQADRILARYREGLKRFLQDCFEQFLNDNRTDSQAGIEALQSMKT